MIRVTVRAYQRGGEYEDRTFEYDADEMELAADSEGTPVLVLSHRDAEEIVAMFSQWSRVEKIGFKIENQTGGTVTRIAA
jgi:hypothetical protein